MSWYIHEEIQHTLERERAAAVVIMRIKEKSITCINSSSHSNEFNLKVLNLNNKFVCRACELNMLVQIFGQKSYSLRVSQMLGW